MNFISYRPVKSYFRNNRQWNEIKYLKAKKDVSLNINEDLQSRMKYEILSSLDEHERKDQSQISWFFGPPNY